MKTECEMTARKAILVCEDSLEGIFTSVYEGWTLENHGEKVQISVREPDYPDFFTRVCPVTSDTQKAEKVLRTIRDKLGQRTYEALCFTAVSCHPEKGTLVFRVLRQAISGRRFDRRIMDNMADPSVNLTAKLRIRVWHEIHRFYGFVRFREISGKVLLAKIRPENDILEMLAPHFSDRFPNENWMILDSGRQKVLLHPQGGVCSVYKDTGTLSQINASLCEKDLYEDLWKGFCRSITIQERKNPHLQQQLLPLKFRLNMHEFS